MSTLIRSFETTRRPCAPVSKLSMRLLFTATVLVGIAGFHWSPSANGQSVTEVLHADPGVLVRLKLNDESLRVLQTSGGLSDAQLAYVERAWAVYRDAIHAVATGAVERLDTDEIDKLVTSGDLQQAARATEMISTAERSTRTSSDAARTAFFTDIRSVLDESQLPKFDQARCRAVCVAAADGPLRGAAAQDFLKHPDLRGEFITWIEMLTDAERITPDQDEMLREVCATALEDHERDLANLVVRATYEHFDAYQRMRVLRMSRDADGMQREQRQMYRAWHRVYTHTKRSADAVRVSLADAFADDESLLRTLLPECWRYHVLHAYLPDAIGVETVAHLHNWLHSTSLEIPEGSLATIDSEYTLYLQQRVPLLEQVVNQRLRDFEQSGHRGRTWSDDLKALQRLRFEHAQSLLRAWRAVLNTSPQVVAEFNEQHQRMCDDINGHIPIDSQKRWSSD